MHPNEEKTMKRKIMESIHLLEETFEFDKIPSLVRIHIPLSSNINSLTKNIWNHPRTQALISQHQTDNTPVSDAELLYVVDTILRTEPDYAVPSGNPETIHLVLRDACGHELHVPCQVDSLTHEITTDVPLPFDILKKSMSFIMNHANSDTEYFVYSAQRLTTGEETALPGCFLWINDMKSYHSKTLCIR